MVRHRRLRAKTIKLWIYSLQGCWPLTATRCDTEGGGTAEEPLAPDPRADRGPSTQHFEGDFVWASLSVWSA